MKKAYLISCSDHYSDRFEALAEGLRELGLESVYITSDFDHRHKIRYHSPVPGCVQLSVPAYSRNLSVSRLISHVCFAQKAFRYLDSLSVEPALVVTLLPPNSLAMAGAWYKKRRPGVTLVYDLFDMWPESFPYAGKNPLLKAPFFIWRKLREAYLPAADMLTSECAYFLNKIPEGITANVIPISRPEAFLPSPGFTVNPLTLCYLGSINHVADIEGISAFIKVLASRVSVTMRIIGSGEQCERFCSLAENAGANVIYYGALYDQQEKAKALEGCAFGLNFMRQDACIGLTMKSVDYLSHSLPLISNVRGDTQSLMAHGGGIHCDSRHPEKTVDALLSLTPEDYEAMRRSAFSLYQRYFSPEAVRHIYLSLYRELLAAHPKDERSTSDIIVHDGNVLK
ncbi:MAG: glycosyltransferase [Christensenellales bacterium]|jgi:glycosyltransferase involved in cell wall biosynthesis